MPQLIQQSIKEKVVLDIDSKEDSCLKLMNTEYEPEHDSVDSDLDTD